MTPTKLTLLPEARYGLFNYMFTVDSSLVDSSTVIKHFFDSAQGANMGKIFKINKLLSDTNGVTMSELSAAHCLNNNISSPDTAESIYKKVFGIMIAMYYAGGPYIPTVSSQITTLDSIAPFCPDQYGNGVFLARALISQIDSTVWGDNCTGGSGGGGGDGGGDGGGGDHPLRHITQKDSNTINNGLTALVYPNPANTILNVELSESPGQEPAYIYLYNQMGELVLTYKLTNSITAIPVSSLSEGIYHYRIIDAKQNSVKADNVLIIR